MFKLEHVLQIPICYLSGIIKQAFASALQEAKSSVFPHAF